MSFCSYKNLPVIIGSCKIQGQFLQYFWTVGGGFNNRDTIIQLEILLQLNKRH